MKQRALTAVLIIAAAAIIGALVYFGGGEDGQTSPTPSTAAAPTATPVEETAPEVSEQPATTDVAADTSLLPADDPTADLKARVVVSGTVTAASGGPIPNATVIIGTYPNLGQTLEMVEEELARTKTDAQGRYSIAAKEFPFHFLRVEADGYALAAVLIENPGWYTLTMQGLEPSGTRTANQDFVLEPAAAVSGIALDDSGNPVAGALISLQGKHTDHAAMWRDMAARQTRVTDAAGRFVFANAIGGAKMIGASAEGYLPLQKDITAPDESIELRFTSKGAFVRGHVYQLSNGDIVSSATVYVTRTFDADPIGTAFELRMPLKGVSDDSGAFLLGPLPAGKYFVTGEKDNSKSYDKEGVLEITAADGEVLRDVYLYGGHAVTGRVTEIASGDPVEGVEVAIGHPTFVDGKVVHNTKDVTNADGRYRITGVFVHGSMGTQLPVSIKKEGYSLPRESNNPWQQATVTFSMEELETVRDFQVARDITISGVVLYPDGTPVRRGQVSSETEFPQKAEPTEIKSDGTFTLFTSPMSSSSVRAQVEGYPDAYSELVEVLTEPVTGVEIRLQRAGSLAGIVVDTKGTPVEGATVKATRNVPIGKRMSRGAPVGEVTTDRAGRFTLNNVPPSEIQVDASKEGYAKSRRETYTLKAGEHRTDAKLMLREPHFLAGLVLDADEKPIQGASVSVFARNGGYYNNTSTDTAGRFRFDAVPDEAISLSVYHQNESQSFENLKLDDPEQKLVFGTTPSATLIGTVIDQATRKPITNYTLSKRPGSGGGEPTKVPEAPHTFRWDKLKTNWYLALEIEAPGYAKHTAEIDVQPGQRIIERTFELGAGGTLTGRIVNAETKQPLENAQVMLLKETDILSDREDIVAMIKTTGDGRFTFEKVPAPKARIRISAGAPYTDKVIAPTIKHGELTDLGDVLMDQGKKLTVITVDAATGAAVPNIPVELYRGPSYVGTKIGEGVTDAAGKYVFTGVNAESHYMIMPSQNVYVSFQNSPGDREVKLRVGNSTLKATVLRGGKPVGVDISLYANIGDVAYSFRQVPSTDDNGLSVITPLTGGPWTISIVRGRDWQSAYRQTIEIPPTGVLEKTFNLPMGEIAGRVVDVEGNPVSGARVSYSKPGADNRGAMADARGEFKIENLDAGSYALMAEAEGLGRAAETITLAEDEAKEGVELVLKNTGGTLVSTVLRYEDGQPLQEAWANLTRTDGLVVENAGTRDASGVMKIEFLLPGTYNVEVSYWGYSISNHTVEIREGETAEIDDVLYRAGALRWTVNLPAGVDEGEYELTPVDPNSIERVRSGQVRRGQQVVERGLWPGMYRGVIRADGRTVTESIEIILGELTQMETTVGE